MCKKKFWIALSADFLEKVDYAEPEVFSVKTKEILYYSSFMK